MGLNPCFLKIISSHTHAFCSSISMLWDVSKFFFKTVFFLKNFVSLCLFRLIQSVFRSIEIVLKFLSSLCLFQSIETVFRSIETRESGFKKIRFDLFKPLFQELFKKFFSLSDSARLHNDFFFFCFPPSFLQGFSLHKPVCPYYPSFCIVFHDFMHYFMVFG